MGGVTSPIGHPGLELSCSKRGVMRAGVEKTGHCECCKMLGTFWYSGVAIRYCCLVLRLCVSVSSLVGQTSTSRHRVASVLGRLGHRGWRLRWAKAEAIQRGHMGSGRANGVVTSLFPRGSGFFDPCRTSRKQCFLRRCLVRDNKKVR